MTVGRALAAPLDLTPVLMLVRVALAVCLFAIPAAQAQQAIDGTVSDAVTGETLIGATVSVLSPTGAVTGGAATNAEGRFSVRASIPASLAVRYIGYETARLSVDAGTGLPLRVRLHPDVAELGEAVVMAGEDPAVRLLRRVIERTRAQRASLGPYAVSAYGRTILRMPSGEIRGVVERVTDAYWAPRSEWREVVVSQRKTENLGTSEGFSSVARGLVDLLDPDVRVLGHTLMGPTHPDALGTYDAEIVRNSAIDGRLVVTLAVRPKRVTASAFEGTLDVFFDTADVVSADLRPGASFLFPPPVRIEGARYRQQFVPVTADSSLWLPADLRTSFRYGLSFEALLSSEPFEVESISQLSSYRLGVVAPDSLLTGAALQRAARPDSARLDAPGVAPPLTVEERNAYAAGDSLGSIQDLLVLHGPLAGIARRNITVSSGPSSDSTEARPLFAVSPAPTLAFNPAETARLGVAVEARIGLLQVEPRAEFRVRDQGVSLGAQALLPLARFAEDRRNAVSLVGEVRDGVGRRVVATAPELLQGVLEGRGGYYDQRLASGGLRLRLNGLGRPNAPQSTFTFTSFERSAVAELRFVAETARRYRPGATDSDLLAFADPSASVPSPSVTVRSLRLDTEIGTLDVPGDLVPRQSVRLVAEAGAFGGPSFRRAEALASFRLPTFARRRALPPALDVRVSGGVAGGDVPAIRRFALEHALGDGPAAVTTFGAFRSRRDVPDAGDRYVMLAYEHSFRTIPFEIVGLGGLAKRGYNVILGGAHGRTWGGPLASRGFTHEATLSLSGLFTGFRLDLSQRLDAPGTVVGFSLARLL